MIQDIRNVDAGAASAGVFSAGQGQPTVARLRLHPAPDLLPADLRPYLTPVFDENEHGPSARPGQPVDWLLNAAAVPDADTETVATSWAAWRSSFVQEWSLGSVAQVHAFAAWSVTECPDLTSLRAVQALPVRLDPATCATLARQVEHAASACRRSSRIGVGFSTSPRPGLLRAALAGPEGAVLLASPDAHARADAEGRLTLVRTAGAEQSFVVLGWELDADTVSVRTTTGRVALHVSDPCAALLARLVPGAGQVGVHAVPATSVFADTLVHLPQAARAAARRGRGLLLTT